MAIRLMLIAVAGTLVGAVPAEDGPTQTRKPCLEGTWRWIYYRGANTAPARDRQVEGFSCRIDRTTIAFMLRDKVNSVCQYRRVPSERFTRLQLIDSRRVEHAIYILEEDRLILFVATGDKPPVDMSGHGQRFVMVRDR